MKPATVQIVVPLYNEAENVAELHARLVAACERLDVSWNVIYVDDGSSDETVAMLQVRARDDARFAVLGLSRNFGHQAAIAAGLSQSNAEAVVLMDGDLQDPPEVIPELVAAWRGGAQVVMARRRSRAETGIKRICLDGFHRVFRYLSDTDIPANTGTFCLLGRDALEAINRLPEVHRFFPGLRAWVGFEQTFVDYDRRDRAHGQPKQTLRRLFRYAADAVLSFSFKPLRLLTLGGCAVCLASFVTACVFIVKRLIGAEPAPIGFTTTLCAIFGLGGMQLIGLGIIGEYLGRVYQEVKRRPLYVTKQLPAAVPAEERVSAMGRQAA